MNGPYDKSITTVFDILGTYFVDIFYNDIYNKSRSIFESGRANSVTEAYKTMSMSYINILSSNTTIYKGIVASLFEYFKKQYSNPGMSFVAFEDKIILSFFPAEYKSTLTDNNKDSLLREIIVNGLGDFIKFLLSPENVVRIIDNHRNSDNVRILQDRFVSIFSAHRESYFMKIVNKLRGGKQTNGTEVSSAVYEDLKQKLVEEVRKRVAIERELGRARRIIEQLTAQIDSLQSRAATVQAAPAREVYTAPVIREVPAPAREVKPSPPEVKPPVREASPPVLLEEGPPAVEEVEVSSEELIEIAPIDGDPEW
jgi:hypothetical protein